MAAKRPSKAERQRRNRALREARQARSAHAGEATEIAQELGSGESDDTGGDRSAATEEPTTERTGSKKTKAGPVAGRRGRQNPFTIPGQRAVMLSFLFSIASIGLLIFTPVRVERPDVPADDPRVDQAEEVEENDDGTVNIIEDVKLLDEETVPVALLIMFTPVAITGAAVFFTKHEKRSTVWTMAMLAIAGYVFFIGGAYAIYTLPALVALGVGGFQSRRAENKERVTELKAQRAARKDAKAKAKGDVIDVDSVDDDD
jgi:hypothetical protein